MQGQLKWINENGTLQMVGNPTPGHENGTCTEFYPSGELKSKKVYRDGFVQGKYVEYYKNGKFSVYGEYKDSEKSGAWIWYNEEGKVTVEKSYD